MRRFLFLFILIFHSSVVFAEKNSRRVSLRAAIPYLANLFHHPVTLSEQVNGVVELPFSNNHPAETYRVILASHHLKEVSLGSLWYVSTVSEWENNQLEEEKNKKIHELTQQKHMKTWVIRYGKAEAIAKLIQDGRNTLLSDHAFLQVDTRTNTLCVSDVKENLQEVDKVIKTLDVPLKQIMISANIVRLDESHESELGMRFTSSSGEDKSDKSAMNEFGILVAKLANHSFLNAKLAALEHQGVAKLISHPRLFTNNEETAYIESGEEVPYQEVSESGGTAVTFKKAVLALKVTPKVLPNNDVLLSLEVSQDRPSAHLVQGVPTINTQHIRTSVVAKDGQTVVLGGIYEQDTQQGSDGLPFLSRIPLLGRLFVQHDDQTDKRELIIFVTPKIIMG